MKHAWEETERKAKVAQISKLTQSLSKFKLIVHIVQLMLVVGEPMRGNANSKRPHCYLSFWRTRSKKSYIEGGEDSEA